MLYLSSCVLSTILQQCYILLKCEKEKMSEHQNLGEFDAHVAKRYQVSKLWPLTYLPMLELPKHWACLAAAPDFIYLLISLPFTYLGLKLFEFGAKN